MTGDTPLALALKPPGRGQGFGTCRRICEYLLKHTGTAELLRKLGATT